MATPTNTTPRARQIVCSKCQRIVVSMVIAGEVTLVDTEVITVVPYRGDAMKITARRSHSELCMTYALAREAKIAKLKRRAKT